MDKFDVMDVNEKQRERIAELEAKHAALVEAVLAFQDVWEDDDCPDDVWEKGVESTREALFKLGRVD